METFFEDFFLSFTKFSWLSKLLTVKSLRLISLSATFSAMVSKMLHFLLFLRSPKDVKEKSVTADDTDIVGPKYHSKITSLSLTDGFASLSILGAGKTLARTN